VHAPVRARAAYQAVAQNIIRSLRDALEAEQDGSKEYEVCAI
jgi:hypothetical protein